MKMAFIHPYLSKATSINDEFVFHKAITVQMPELIYRLSKYANYNCVRISKEMG